MKKHKKRDEFLAELRKIPIIQVACEKTGISRTSLYRWRDENKEFKEEIEKALVEGEAFVNDMSESQLLTMIKEKNWQAVSFWLKHHHPKYANKLQIEHDIKDEEMNEEQAEIARRALSYVTGKPLVINNNNQNDKQNNERDLSAQPESGSGDSSGVSGEHDQGSESQNGSDQK